MGLFDKKKKGGDDFEGPVEEISLTAEPQSAAERGGQPRSSASGTIQQQPPSQQQPAARRPAAAPEPEAVNFDRVTFNTEAHPIVRTW